MRLLQWTVLLAAFVFTAPAFAVDFSYKDINGKKRQLSDYKGKWVIVNYWGTRCAPCRAEIPELNRIARKYRSNTKILGIELMSSKDSEIRSFMAQNGMRFTVAGTQRSVINPLGTIRTLPTTFIISPEGKVVNKHAGIMTERYVRDFVKGGTGTQVAKKEGPSQEELARIEKEKQDQAKQQAIAEKRKLAEKEEQAEQVAMAEKRKQEEQENQAKQAAIAEQRQQAEQENQAEQIAVAEKRKEAEQQSQAAQQAAQQQAKDAQRAAQQQAQAQAAQPKAPVAAKAPAAAKKPSIHDMLMNYKL